MPRKSSAKKRTGFETVVPKGYEATKYMRYIGQMGDGTHGQLSRNGKKVVGVGRGVSSRASSVAAAKKAQKAAKSKAASTPRGSRKY